MKITIPHLEYCHTCRKWVSIGGISFSINSADTCYILESNDTKTQIAISKYTTFNGDILVMYMINGKTIESAHLSMDAVKTGVRVIYNRLFQWVCKHTDE